MAHALENGPGSMVAVDDDDDRALVLRVGAGDRGALAELYQRHHLPLLHYLLRLAGDRAVAEDLLQETFVAAWQGAKRFAGRSTARTWLLGIARRQAHNTLRRRHPERLGEAQLEALEAPDADPEHAALRDADRTVLLTAIGRLSPIHREVVALVFAEGLATHEIAGLLDIPQGTVKSRLRDAKRALRALLTAGKDD